MTFSFKRYATLAFLLTLMFSVMPRLSPAQGSPEYPSFLDETGRKWVDSVYSALPLHQRIAQLLMIRANSTVDSAEIRRVTDWIQRYNLGGICFFKGGPKRQAILTNHYQSMARTPMLISMDAEWGLGMRLDSTISFARQMTLGAIQDETLIGQYGLEIARQLRRLGVHISFSPVADINNNPANPVINVRSFGEDKNAVSRKAILYMKGLKQGGIMSVAKHFPGHGDTDTDSHLDLPFIDHTAVTLNTLDLVPFRKLIRAGLDGIMIAHLFVPALDTTSNLPSSLSPVIVDTLLRKKLGFQGVVFTDALDMKGASNFAPPGKLEVAALVAGNDVLLLPESVDSAIAHIQATVDSGIISQSLLEERCRKILSLKYRMGLTKKQMVDLAGLEMELNSTRAEVFNSALYENAITLLKNENGLIPLAFPDTLKLASVTIGYEQETLFQTRLSTYFPIDHYYLPREPGNHQIDSIFANLIPYDLVIVSVNNTHPSPARNFGISQKAIQLVDSLIRFRPVILNLFSLPYAIALFRNVSEAKAIIISYQDNRTVYDMAAQLIAGGITSRGRTPVSISERFPMHSGVSSSPPTRLKNALPEEEGLAASTLARVDSIAVDGIRQGAYPGCQVVIALEGKLIYNKAFGHHDYSKAVPVNTNDIYDLASITKVAATTLAVMKLTDEKLIDPGKPLSRYLPLLHGSNKNRMTIEEVMTHQAGLIPWIPFYLSTLRDGLPDTSVYSSTLKERFPFRVANELYIRKDYPSHLLDSIVRSPLLPKKTYKYSDLGFVLLQQTVERIAGTSLDQYVNSIFCSPMGLPTMGFRPLDRFPLSRIVPTESDTVFRHCLVHGDVHDPLAAMFGGVAGHAGLFSNAADLAAMFQMLLNDGKYGGRQFLDSTTIREFTSRKFDSNRRGLGFDKPQPKGEEGPACDKASPNSYGHSGFTGTFVWADPDRQLVIVFLSNRVHPNADDNKLTKLGIRTRIQEVVYDALEMKNLQLQKSRHQLNTTY